MKFKGFCVFYSLCLVVSSYLFIIKGGESLIPIERDGFMNNFIDSKGFTLNNVRCFLVLPWYFLYVNSVHFFAKGYVCTKDEKTRRYIEFLATTNDASKQQILLESLGDGNVFIRLYKKYWPISKLFVKFRALKTEDILMNNHAFCFFVWFLFLVHNIFLYLVFREKLYCLALLAGPFCSLRLLFVFYAGVAWAHLLLYGKKFYLKYFFVCPYVLLSSAASFCLVVWIAISKTTILRKILLTSIVFLFIVGKLVSNNEIANTKIANANGNGFFVVNKVRYFMQRSLLFRDFIVRKYARGCFIWSLVFFYVFLVIKRPNRYVVSSFYIFFLEGLVFVFVLPLLLKSWFRE